MSAISVAATNLAVGSWTTISTDGFTDSLLSTGANYITDYANNIFWTPGTRRMWFLGGPNHGETSKYIYYDEVTNTWVQTAHSVFNEGHQYDKMTAVAVSDGYPGADRAWIMNNTQLEYYESGTGWTDFGPGDSIGGNNFYDALEFFEARNEMWHLVSNQSQSPVVHRLSRANPGAGWSAVTVPGALALSYVIFAAYSRPLQMMIFGGANGGSNVWAADINATVTKKANSPYGIGGDQARVTSDPVTGLFLVIFSNGQMWAFNPSASTVNGVAPNTWVRTTNPPWGATTTGPQIGWIPARSSPDPMPGVIMAIHRGDLSVRLYKHAAQAVMPPPNAPVSLRVVP